MMVQGSARSCNLDKLIHPWWAKAYEVWNYFVGTPDSSHEITLSRLSPYANFAESD